MASSKTKLAEWDADAVARLRAALDSYDGPQPDVVHDRLQELLQANTADSVPEMPVEPISRRGDLWLLGEHRLLCGDSSNAEDVSRLLNGELGVLVATDPPYGVNFGTANHNPTAKDWGKIVGDGRQGQELREWLRGVIETWLPHTSADAAWYVWGPSMAEGHRFYEAIIDAGLHIQGQIIWVKNVFAMGQNDFHWKHEMAWYAFHLGENHRWFGGRDQTTTWEVKRDANAAYLHPTQKPVELFCRPINNHTRKGELCLEPFSGSGTQLIAAEMLGRRCYAMELDPKFADVAVARWESYTRQKAKLVSE